MRLEIQALNKIHLLAELSDEDKLKLIRQLHIKKFKRGEQVVIKDQPSTELYFLISGRLKVVDYSSSGREVGFIFIEEGAHFGELAFIDGKPRSASIVATESSTVAILSANEARQLIYTNPIVTEKLFKQLTHIIRQSNEQIVMLGSNSAVIRVRSLLLKYAKSSGKLLIIDKLPTTNELASMANTTRETVSRTLNQLIKMGVIAKQGSQLQILDVKKIEDLNKEP
jgi:CRP-like cAMP-binding protein